MNHERAGRFHEQAPRTAGLFLLALVLAALAARQMLGAFHLFDDIAILAQVSPRIGGHWTDCLNTRATGFFRPGVKLLHHFCAYAPGDGLLAAQSAALNVHALCCALTGLLLRRAWGLDWSWATLGTALMALHLGAYTNITQLANSCDSLLALAFLTALLAWDHWLATRSRGAAGLLALALLIGVFAKESVVLVAPLLTLWAAARGRLTESRTRRALAAVWALALAYAVWAFWSVSHAELSYTQTGRMETNPRGLLRQWSDFLLALVLPPLRVIAWPFVEWQPSRWLLNGLRGLALAGVGMSALLFVRRPARRMLLLPVLAAALCLTLPALVRVPPHARFLYTALPFFVIAVVLGLARAPGRLQHIAALGVVALWTLFVAGYFFSPTILWHRETGRAVGRFVVELRRVAPRWEAGDRISILNHPHPQPPGGLGHAYSQAIFDAFLPHTRATVIPDKVDPQADRLYLFDGRRLVDHSDRLELLRQETPTTKTRPRATPQGD